VQPACRCYPGEQTTRAGRVSDYGPVERATRAELRSLKVSVQTSILGAAAVAIARQVDVAKGGVSAATAALQLRLIRADLVAEAEKRPQDDFLDELNARRAGRVATG
jgi:hypothetical protein